ncbi:MAG: class I SAM-dependent methyltransferase [Candidatus Magnetobacterium sp. LHC-1]|nr:class I SAM-dependent methyltransferase [Nitrospirota bacterium]
MKDTGGKTYDLNALVSTYNIDNVYEQYKRLEFLEKLGHYIKLETARVIEFGSAMGHMTALLSRIARTVVAVDGSGDFIEIARRRIGNPENVKFCESCFEDFKFDEKFDCLIMHHTLEHIERPALLLSDMKSFLDDDSLVAISVPNAHALSRQLAVKMGLLPCVYELTDNDKCHGHYRVYDWKTLEKQVAESGFNIIGRHGLSFKLFSDKQNIDMLNANIIGEEQIKGLWQLGDEYPDVAGAIMIVAKKDKI